MDPISETVEAVEEYGPFSEGDLLGQLEEQAGRVRALVPECVGLSLTSTEDAVTFTLVASAQEVAALDGLQYVDGGPCVVAAEVANAIEYRSADPLDEKDWQLFAQGCAAAGIMSTLSLPILVKDRCVGSVNLYASTSNAFSDHHEDLAAIFDAWALGAVTNADLSFTTRTAAENAPQQLRDEIKIQVAVKIIIDADDIDLDAAREQLQTAAQRAGISEARLADQIVEARMRRRDAPS